jgi:hypothetical protein
MQLIDRSGEAPQNLYEASAQWRYRPPDERYLDMPSLLEGVQARRERSAEANHFPLANLKTGFVQEGTLKDSLYALQFDDGTPALFTNWSFSQYVSEVGGPDIRWLREMPAAYAADALNASIKWRSGPRAVVKPSPEDSGSLAKLYYATPGEGEPAGWMRAITSPTYGRIYDEQVVRAVMSINQDDRWVVPGAIAGRGMADQYTSVTKQSTTLYASDRDVWMFLVDEQHPLEIDGDLYFRGFITSNSEVGKAVFRLMTFLLRQVCMNRIIWGATQIQEFRIKHTSMAPTRFIEEAAPKLAAYGNASVRGVQDAIRGAQKVLVADTQQEAVEWLRARDFTKDEAVVTVALARDADDIGSSGDPTCLWNLAMGASAYARELVHADTRVAFEERIGRMLDVGVGR